MGLFNKIFKRKNKKEKKIAPSELNKDTNFFSEEELMNIRTIEEIKKDMNNKFKK